MKEEKAQIAAYINQLSASANNMFLTIEHQQAQISSLNAWVQKLHENVDSLLIRLGYWGGIISDNTVGGKLDVAHILTRERVERGV